MKIVAIDSSGLTASISVITETDMFAEYTINYKKTHSQTLLPMIDEVVRMLELDLHTIDAIAVSKGPGSFTGLRIGSATAKGLALALDKPIVGVPTVDALAYNMYGYKGVICPLMDARRNEVYTGLYAFENGDFKVLKEQMAVDVLKIVDMINECGRPVIFLGDGVVPYIKQIEEKIQVPYEIAPPHMLKQRAGAAGALAIRYYNEGKAETAAEFKPVYLRLSQAERELIEKKTKENKEYGQ